MAAPWRPYTALAAVASALLATYALLAALVMHWFLKLLINPLLDALGPRVIVEIGVEVGAVSVPLLRWAQANGATLHAIDPDPTLSVDRLEAEYGEQLRFHRRRSLEALAEIAAVDLALIDGDHNWYTVINELRALERSAHKQGREPAVMLLHDVGWPYGRRDLYYDPSSIPEAHRQPHARGGLKPGRAELGPGLNDHLQNAQLEGTPANGVLSAVEDFIAQSDRAWRMWQIPGLSGMVILASEPVLDANPALRELLDSSESPAFLRAHCEAIEEARIDAELKRANISRRLAETQLKQVMRNEDPHERVELQRRVRELTERVQELEQELEGRVALVEQVRVLEGEVARLRSEALAAEPDTPAEPNIPAQPDTPAAPHAPAKPDARAEREAWSTLLAEYVPLLEAALPCADERDPLSLPCPLDLRGILREAGAEQAPGEPSVDVVVCVHDAPDEVRECLSSLLAMSDRPLRLILVNDGSDEPTTHFLRAFADRHPAVTLIHRETPPHGYTLAANRGIEATESDYVVLLNSDTVVTDGWLGRIVTCGESNEQVGILGVLSNAASHQSVPRVREGSAWARNPLPAWLTVAGMGVVVANGMPGAATPLPFLNGFCYTIKRAVIEAVGLLDEERFAAGYCEENDYSLRARAAGFGLAVVSDAYVHHAKSRSYGAEAREELAHASYEAFLEKHGQEEVSAQVAQVEADAGLEPVRAAVTRNSANPRAVAELLAGPKGEPLSVVFLLPGLAHGGSGGSHSLYQETRALRSLGVPARIMLPRWDMERAAAVYEDAQEIFEAFADEEDLSVRTADADVISATHHKSVALLSAIRERRSDFLAAYYIQDYEPFFTAPYVAQEAVASYTALPEMLLFAKSHWLCNVVAERHGLFVAKVEASIDRELFTPGAGRSRADPRETGVPGASGPGANADGPLRVVAMVRPRTARRQPLATIAVLEELLARHPGEVRVSTFGCYTDELRELLGAGAPGSGSEAIIERHLGLLSRAEVAELLRESDVFLDCSVYQAFGRTALEAMACGATAVVPNVGGVWEFVRQGENALAVDTLSPQAALQALSELTHDRKLLRRLQAGALDTAAGYSAIRAALSEYVLFSRAHRARFGEPAGDLPASSSLDFLPATLG
ncbi:MAG TPA: glycosyltransferase [Solirubrobacteraceae bacterium]|nr:glycosyltransferase [Solirubrobacteraceae bacterium]